jgi:hypothetical protein
MTTPLVRCLCALVAIHAFAFAESACSASDSGAVEALPVEDDPAAANDLSGEPPGAASTPSSAPVPPAPSAKPDAGSAPPPAPPPAACPGRVEIEPNDTKPELLAGAVCGKLAAIDVDTFSVPVKEDERVTFALQVSAGATLAIDGAGVHVAAAGPAIGPLTVRANKKGVLTVVLSKALVPLVYTLKVTRS